MTNPPCYSQGAAKSSYTPAWAKRTYDLVDLTFEAEEEKKKLAKLNPQTVTNYKTPGQRKYTVELCAAKTAKPLPANLAKKWRKTTGVQ